ncbi:diphthine synthase, partial [Nanoarchaeota archaeon]
ALELLEEVERRRERAGKEAGILKEVLFVGVARAGSETQVVKADYADALKRFDFGEPPHVLVALGELHFMEKEALVRLASAPL